MKSFIETFQERFQVFVEDHRLVPPNSHALLGVSGGLDSMAMMHLFHSCRPGNCTLSVVHVNHQLRGAESDGDEQLVREAAEALGLPFFSRRIDVLEHKKKTGLSSQEAARELRYECYAEVRLLAQADLVATAHHANDNAETVLMNALRGAGIRGLSGIPIRRTSGNVIRPLLFSTRGELQRYVEELKIPFREDSSNASLKYTRNFLRRELLPALGDRMQTDIVASLNRVSAIMHSMVERLETEVQAQFNKVVTKDNDHFVISIPALKNQPVYLQEEIILHLFRTLAIEPSVRKIQASLSLLQLPTGKSVRLQNQWSLYRDRDRLLFANPEHTAFRYDLQPGHEYVFPGFRFAVRPVGEFPFRERHASNIEYVDAGRLKEPLVLRTWKEGDSFVPFGMTCEKKLSDFFTDQKIPLPRKRTTPLLEADGAIVWVCGLRLDNRFRVTPATRTVARLEYSPSQHNIQ